MLNSFPIRRGRRIRQSDEIRSLVRETSLSKSDLISPIFIKEGKNNIEQIPSMPGIYRYSIDQLIPYVEKLLNAGILAVALFPLTPLDKKSSRCEEAWNSDNLVNKATRILKKNFPKLIVMLEIALDPYNSDGHDGLLIDGKIANDETLIALQKQALVQAEAGADILGPSDMMDGRIKAIRDVLEEKHFRTHLLCLMQLNFPQHFMDHLGKQLEQRDF